MASGIKECWRWPETRWTSSDIDWRKGKVITAGVDVGAVSTQAVIMADGELYAFGNKRTGASSTDSADRAMKWAVEGTGLTGENIQYIVGTGYGKANVPGIKKTLTDVACHSLGANYIYGPSVRTVLDIGGLDFKVIRCDEKGRVISSLRNEKCTSGIGRGMEVFADLLSIPVQEIGERSFQIDREPEALNGSCAISAKTEAIEFLRNGSSVEMVLAAYCRSMADRIFEILMRQGIEKAIAITGGQVKNTGVVKRIEKLMGFEALEWHDIDPQIAGGIGAALFAKAIIEK